MKNMNKYFEKSYITYLLTKLWRRTFGIIILYLSESKLPRRFSEIGFLPRNTRKYYYKMNSNWKYDENYQ